MTDRSKSEPRGCLGVLAGLIRLIVSTPQQAKSAPPYVAKQYLLSANERAFLRILEQVIPEGTRVFCQICLADLVFVKKGTQERQAWHNKSDRKTIDFVLVDSKMLKPMLAMELDDRSHEQSKRIVRDQFVQEALAAAKVPLLRVKAQRTYNTQELRQAIRSHLSKA